MDFLGLRNLSVIDDTQKALRRTMPDFSIDAIPMDDPEVYRMIAAGETEGVFQFESPGMKNVIVQLRPESLEDLIAVVSLYRPGPMESIPRYIANRHHPEQVTYRHPLLEPILQVTYGCIVYQEQVMQIFRTLGGVFPGPRGYCAPGDVQKESGRDGTGTADLPVWPDGRQWKGRSGGLYPPGDPGGRGAGGIPGNGRVCGICVQ